MAKTATISLRLSPSTKELLEKFARSVNRSQSYVVEDALKFYIDINEWQLQAIEEGIREADEGKLTSHEEVKSNWEEKLADTVDR